MKRILAAFLLLLAVVTVDGLVLSAQERPVPAFDRILQEPQYAYLEYYLYKVTDEVSLRASDRCHWCGNPHPPTPTQKTYI